MRILHLSIPLLILACGSDEGIKKFNNPPTASITSHSDGDEILEGYVQIFEGTVNDLNHNNSELSVVWSTGQRELCPPQPPDSNGKTTCEMAFVEGETKLQLQVNDPDGDVDFDEITLVIIPTDAPTAQIITPEPTGTYYSNQLILFSAIIDDAEDDPADLTFSWTSSIDGELPCSCIN